MLSTLSLAALLLTSLLFGGMVLFSFGFAAFTLTHLPSEQARSLIRQAFPIYYLLVIGVAALAAVAMLSVDSVSAGLLLAIVLTTAAARQGLMPAINAATDRGDKRVFGQLHGLSVVIQIAQIIAAAVVLARWSA